ncbi:hypothetical protein B0H11DRAFT_2261124 [Mycena galericulata]|nr:hypothetical protein B0H11DRAFT_2261124 [Mycena galericulata]
MHVLWTAELPSAVGEPVSYTLQVFSLPYRPYSRPVASSDPRTSSSLSLYIRKATSFDPNTCILGVVALSLDRDDPLLAQPSATIDANLPYLVATTFAPPYAPDLTPRRTFAGLLASALSPPPSRNCLPSRTPSISRIQLDYQPAVNAVLSVHGTHDATIARCGKKGGKRSTKSGSSAISSTLAFPSPPPLPTYELAESEPTPKQPSRAKM